MFGKKDHRKKSGGGLVGIFRLIWSLFVLVVLGVGLVQAYKSFSGYDPLKIDPKSGIKGLLNSDSAYEFFTNLLTFNPSTAFDKTKQALGNTNSSPQPGPEAPKTELKYKFAVIADSHKDTANLAKALNMAKDAGSKFVIGIGDFSDVGTVDELVNSKKEFDTVNLPYYVTAGDHDLWDSRNKKVDPLMNFRQVFGNSYQSFTYDNARFLLVYDTDNYLGLDDMQLKWIDDQLSDYQNNPTKLFFVFAGTPFFHPSSDHVMGKVTPKLKGQADHLISILSRNKADQLFFADTHFFSNFQEPTTNLKMTTVGAVTSDRNPQTPRFAIVDVYVDGSYNIEETEIK